MLRQPHRPKWTEKLFFFLAGIIVSAPFPFLVNSTSAFYLSQYLPNSFFFLSAVIIGPVLEEFTKAYPLYFRHGETQKSLMTLGFFTGLGFGVTEFFFYTMLYHAPVSMRLLPIFFHAASAMIIAYGIGHGKSLRFYLAAVILHFIVNYSAFSADLGLYSYFLAIFLAIILAVSLYQKSSELTIDS